MKFSILVLPIYIGLSKAAIGDLCTPDGGITVGTCELTSWCSDNKGYDKISNLCPNDPDDVKCCFSPLCYHGQGSCEDKATFTQCVKLGGHYLAGYCPGPTDYQCCLGPGT
ncbi:hypothetical protein V8E51_009981 [Hyaloscypha variabilis]|uniref:Uncharacterized protein n=1 Tax=Hyaloscypha variabilis (strain UAMH 11265 / GT02V1 / F) TaxID=1149755 RepID=A0A2J6S8K5_HYAVF|nr:hypothetical protein L207DRAFT_417008 [Hyaloscypha variabilis F]